jgi:hypothetical protein
MRQSFGQQPYSAAQTEPNRTQSGLIHDRHDWPNRQ